MRMLKIFFARRFARFAGNAYLCRMEVRRVFRAESREEYLREHLRIAEPLMPASLTPVLRETLAAIMAGDPEDPLGPGCRSRIARELGLGRQNMSMRLRELRDRGFVVTDPITGRLRVPAFLYPDPGRQLYRIMLWEDGEDG